MARSRVGRVVEAGAAYRGEQGPDYIPGISAETVGAQGLWLGSVVIPPGGRTNAHLHANHEPALHRVSGDLVELWTGEQLEERAVAYAGDSWYIPAGVPPVAINRGQRRAVFVGACTDSNEPERLVLCAALDARVP